MPGKVQLDKAAWNWVESVQNAEAVTPIHVDIAYRLNLAPCPTGQCRRNCRGNPFCLNGLGEKSWFKELDESQWNDFNPETVRREDGKFVGLKNLGATCYVNTFLQLWFHNPAVRRAVYQWRNFDEPSETDIEWKPSTICGHLQLLFGFMQYSRKSYIDPTPLIESLGLDTKEQQDAQEFSKLFLSKLGEALMQGTFIAPSNIVQQQFAGSYCYVTKCNKCGSESSLESTFYELDINIQGHSGLISALQEFLKEEKLEGENQYMCSVCDSKQNAVRSIKLRALPPVLNLQLLRFVFDVKKGYKKKLNSYLQFADLLDMSQFLGQPAMTTVYDLTAVLIHRGPSAHSGHYIAHIQDTVTKLWFRFNDEDITAMKGRKLQLGKEEDVTAGDIPELDGPAPKAPRTSKGQHSSRDAYMLVYTRREPDTGKGDQPATETKDTCELPPSVKAFIDRDNDTFENWIQEIALTRDANIFSGKERQKLIQTMYSDLQFSDPGAGVFEWVPVDWLSSWLADPDKAQPISCTSYLCPHQKLHPDNVVKMKIVSIRGAEKLYEEYGGDYHLIGREAMCIDCVRQRCTELHLKEQISEHSRFLTAELKKTVDSDQCYWVGKTSLRCWKQYALDQIETSNGNTSTAESAGEEGDMDTSAGDGEGVEMKKAEENGDGDNSKQDEGNNGKQDDDDNNKEDNNDSVNNSKREMDDDSTSIHDTFNSDLLCEPHGALHPDEGCRRLVSEAAWKRLLCFFPTCPQFQKNDPVCEQCLKNLTQEQEAKKQYRQLFARQREQLQDLYLCRNRPRLKQLSLGAKVFIIHSGFLDSWRKFVRSREGGNTEALTSIVNKPLLCEHNKLVYTVDLQELDVSEDLSFVWEMEWQCLTEYYGHDVPIEVSLTHIEGQEQPSIVTVPEVCDGCMAQRLQAEEENLYAFEDATIFVRKVVEPIYGVSTVPDTRVGKYEQDPDFMESQAKKQRLDEGVVRKSQRHRKQRGEKEFRVSSDMTLKEFKTKVMYQFTIPTFDQNLMLDGCLLTDNEATLGQLRFYPGCVVTVKADEPNHDAVADMDNSSARKPEEGFKGTNLLSS